MPELKERVQDLFIKQMQELKGASPLTRDNKVKKLMSQVDRLLRSEDGVEFLYQQLPDLMQAGIFKDTSWEDPSALVAHLVGGTLKAGNPSTDMELLSELRLLVLCNENKSDDRMSSSEAEQFLESVIVLNLDLIYAHLDKMERLKITKDELNKIQTVFEFLLDHISIQGIKEEIAEELKLISAQRPVFTGTLRDIIRLVNDHIELDTDREVDRRIAVFRRTLAGPTDASLDLSDREYKDWVDRASDQSLEAEASVFAKSMYETGLVSSQHVILLSKLVETECYEAAKEALRLSDTGRIQFDEHRDIVIRLIRDHFTPTYGQAVYGISLALNKGLLSSNALKYALEHLLEVRLHPEIVKQIRLSREAQRGKTEPLDILIGGTLNVLGRPLGIGQGLNPTCQSARAISLWSEYAPAKLVNMIFKTASENNLNFRFEGHLLQSKDLLEGLATEFDYTLDPVSVVLVPHLDKVYSEMMRRASFRTDDPHKWVNPAFYGHWIPTGFASAYHYGTQAIKGYDAFIRTFYAAFHPEWNGGRKIIYPIPLGLFITSSKAEMLGFHAVSMLRVAKDQKGVFRVYFLNPNNEGRQNWGQGIKPTVYGQGEEPGESSLPFVQFASRVYAFHYISTGVDERAAQLPEEKVQEVRSLAEDSWGTKYTWID